MSGFWIDVYSNAGAQENGHAYNVRDVSFTDKVNKIGQVLFTLPAAILPELGAAFGKRYRLYSELAGYLGQYRHKSLTIDADNLTATITADDTLIDLANRIVGFNRAYGTGNTVASIINSLVAAAGWTASYDTGFVDEDITAEFQGESFLTALDTFRAYVRGWFRRESDAAIKFGVYQDLATAVVAEADIAARLMNVPVVSSDTSRGAFSDNDNTEYALVTKLTQVIDGTSVVNRIYPVGAGLGVTQLNLGRSTLSGFPYIIHSTANPDGSLRYYIELAASQALYGIVERVLPFNDIRPITNSDADIAAAADALYVMGAAYLRSFGYPFSVYALSCINLPAAAEPGSIITLEFRGVATLANGETAWLHVDKQAFYILEKTTRYDENGTPFFDLVISSNGEGNVSSTDIFVNTLRDIERFKGHPTPGQTYYTKANPTLAISQPDSVGATFGFVIGAEVLYINDMVLEMRLSRLTSYSVTSITAEASTTGASSTSTTASNAQQTSGASSITTTISGGGSTPTSADASPDVSGVQVDVGGGNHNHNINHSHSVAIPAHTHGMEHTHTVDGHQHGMEHTHGIPAGTLVSTYGIYSAPTLPTNVQVTLDGVPITNWTLAESFDTASTDGTNCSGDGIFRANITGLFPATGIAGNYRLAFTCGANAGLVFAQLLGRITIQPIAVTT